MSEKKYTLEELLEWIAEDDYHDDLDDILIQLVHKRLDLTVYHFCESRERTHICGEFGLPYILQIELSLSGRQKEKYIEWIITLLQDTIYHSMEDWEAAYLIKTCPAHLLIIALILTLQEGADS